MAAEFVWHFNHDRMLGLLLIPLEERLRQIREQKPARERPLRERLLSRVQGQLPAPVIEAGTAYVQAQETTDQVLNASGEAYIRAWDTYSQAWKAYTQACEAHRAEIEALHAIECPGCPWDGQTIFREGT